MNSKDILILCSNDKYLDHCKFIFSMFDDKCNWDIDKCLIVDESVKTEDLSTFINKGIIIKRVPKQTKPYLIKFYLFDEYFKNWENILYLDVDIYIFNDIKEYFKTNCTDVNKIYACEDVATPYTHFCFRWDIKMKNKIIKNIEEKYNIDLTKKFFNSGILYFNTKNIKSDTVNKLFEIQQDLMLENNHNDNGTDQPIINLLFKDNSEFLEKTKFTLGTKFNRNNDRSLNEKNTLIHHFFGYFAPWKTIIQDNYVDYPFNEEYIKYLTIFNS